MSRYLYVMLVLVVLGWTSPIRAQSCYSSSYAAPAMQYQYTEGDGQGQSCYSQSYVAPQSRMQTYAFNQTDYIVTPRSTPRYETGISPNAIYFPPQYEDRLVGVTPIPPPVYRAPPPPIRPQPRVRTVMVQPAIRQATTVYQNRQPLFNGFLRGSSSGGCPGGVCR